MAVVEGADHDRVDIARQHLARCRRWSRRGRAASRAPVSMIVSPPSSRMPTSKETRVRVDGLSKIMASVRPASGFSARWRVRRSAFSRRPRRGCRGASRASMSARSRKWRTMAVSLAFGLRLDRRARRAPRRSGAIALVDLRLGDDQRRQEADDVLAGADAEQALRRASRRRRRPTGTTQRTPSEQALAAHLVDDVGM